MTGSPAPCDRAGVPSGCWVSGGSHGRLRRRRLPTPSHVYRREVSLTVVSLHQVQILTLREASVAAHVSDPFVRWAVEVVAVG